MAEFRLTDDEFEDILTMTEKHLRGLDNELAAIYSDNPSEAFTVAIAASIIITLDSINNAGGKHEVVDAINRILKWFQRPWRIVSIS